MQSAAYEDLVEKWRKYQVDKYKGRVLYVRGLDENFTDEDLKAFFSEYGVVDNCKIATKMEGDREISKKYGFVCFESAEEAARVLEKSSLEINGKPIYVALITPPSERLSHD